MNETTDVLRWNRDGYVWVLASDGRVLKRLHSSSDGFETVGRLSALEIPLVVSSVLQHPDCVVVG